jgi:hypothetical protein
MGMHIKSGRSEKPQANELIRSILVSFRLIYVHRKNAVVLALRVLTEPDTTENRAVAINNEKTVAIQLPGKEVF